MDELEQLAQELRDRIIDVVSDNGGHLASPLGVVDLTVALHHVFDAETDRIIWDVGHQCYAHKVLTGRREQLPSLRKQHGISGYPKLSETHMDAFGTGHSSTSISAALGMAAARQLSGEDYKTVALIGDGAMTAGMAVEALSHAGDLGLDMLVILNDNEMSISPNVGALSQYLSRIITARPYKRAKEDVGSFVKQIIGNRMTRTVQEIEKSVKGFITHGTFFQELGFNYVGPVDGHDLPVLVECLNNLKQMTGPVLFHVVTEKGKGLRAAEEDPLKFHGVKPGPLRPSQRKQDQEGEALPSRSEQARPKSTTFTDAFVEGLIEAAMDDPRIVGITAAMPTGTGLHKFQERFPDRFFDVGIAEQHAVTFAAGLAAQGMRPVAAIYSTFLQRGYDQLIHDVCIQNLPVTFAIDRAGLVGEDSPTQNGTFDLSFLRCVPNLQVLAPRDDVDLRAMIQWAVSQETPIAVRYARSAAPAIGPAEGRPPITRGEVLRPGNDAMFLVCGPCAAHCLAAAEVLEAEGISIGVADARIIKPLDTELLDDLAGLPLITVEENTLPGGFGAAVLEHFQDTGRLHDLRLKRIGIPDEFTEQATRDEQLAYHELDAAGLAAAARAFVVGAGVPHTL